MQRLLCQGQERLQPSTSPLGGGLQGKTSMSTYRAGEPAGSRQHTSHLSPSGLPLLRDGRSEVHQHAVLGAQSRGPAQCTQLWCCPHVATASCVLPTHTGNVTVRCTVAHRDAIPLISQHWEAKMGEMDSDLQVLQGIWHQVLCSMLCRAGRICSHSPDVFFLLLVGSRSGWHPCSASTTACLMGLQHGGRFKSQRSPMCSWTGSKAWLAF